MIHIKDVREAIKGLPDEAPLSLRLVNAPEGLEVDFFEIKRDGGRVVILGEAFAPDEEADNPD